MGVRAAPTTLRCAIMISTRNCDEKYGPPFMNSLGIFTPTLAFVGANMWSEYIELNILTHFCEISAPNFGLGL